MGLDELRSLTDQLPLDQLADLLLYLGYKNHHGSPLHGYQPRQYDGTVWAYSPTSATRHAREPGI